MSTDRQNVHAQSVHDFCVEDLSGKPVDLQQFRGKILLIVNTASQCGFTPQYKELEAIYRQFRQHGVEVLGFPCNQFRQQEPGTAEEIHAFCEKNYGVTFPLFAKIDVNGEHAHPLFAHLKHEAPGLFGTEAIKWNFTKFLIRQDGSVYKRYAPQTKPEKIIPDLERLLHEQPAAPGNT